MYLLSSVLSGVQFLILPSASSIYNRQSQFQSTKGKIIMKFSESHFLTWKIKY